MINEKRKVINGELVTYLKGWGFGPTWVEADRQPVHKEFTDKFPRMRAARKAAARKVRLYY